MPQLPVHSFDPHSRARSRKPRALPPGVYYFDGSGASEFVSPESPRQNRRHIVAAAGVPIQPQYGHKVASRWMNEASSTKPDNRVHDPHQMPHSRNYGYEEAYPNHYNGTKAKNSRYGLDPYKTYAPPFEDHFDMRRAGVPRNGHAFHHAYGSTHFLDLVTNEQSPNPVVFPNNNTDHNCGFNPKILVTDHNMNRTAVLGNVESRVPTHYETEFVFPRAQNPVRLTFRSDGTYKFEEEVCLYREMNETN